MTEQASTPVIVDGLDITACVAKIEEQGYAVVPQFIAPEEVATIRHALMTEVPITEMAAIGTTSGLTWRAHPICLPRPGRSTTSFGCSITQSFRES